MNLLNTKQAAELLGITPRRVVAMIEDGSIKAHRIGREYAIEESALAGVKTYGKAGRPPKDQPAAKRKAKKAK